MKITSIPFSVSRRLFTALLLCFPWMVSIGQVSTYTVTRTTETYVPLTTGTQVFGPGAHNEITNGIPIGFTFTYTWADYTDVGICTNGYISPGCTYSWAESYGFENEMMYFSVIAPLWESLATGDSGSVSYELSGTSPDRIFTVEYKGIRWPYNTTNENRRFQIKLYETTNAIKFIYDIQDTAEYSSAEIGLLNVYGGPGQFISVLPGISPENLLVSCDNVYYVPDSPHLENGVCLSFTPNVCDMPYTLPMSAVSLTPGEATLVWNNIYTPVEIEWGPAGFIHGSGTIITGVNYDTLTITGLAIGTEYEYYVRTNCGSGNYSNWAGPFLFNTECSPVSVFPYLEPFHNYELPECWSQMKGYLLPSVEIKDRNDASWRVESKPQDQSDSAAYIYCSGSMFEWLITPVFNIGTTQDYRLDFDVFVDGIVEVDDAFAVVISTDGVTWSETNILKLWDYYYPDVLNDLTNEETHIILPLSSYSGKIRIAFEAETNDAFGQDFRIYVDNVEIKPLLTCMVDPPLNLTSHGRFKLTTPCRWS